MPSLPHLPPREPDSHKGDYGRALLAGGSRGMTGAIALAGMAALRSGAGLVTLAVPGSVQQVVASFDPCYMTVPLPEHDDQVGQICAPARMNIEKLAENANCVAFGPGLGQGEGLNLLAAWLYEHMTIPAVMDADGLNALARRPEGLANPGGPRILTPHPGEFARLVGEEIEIRDRAHAEEIATQMAGANGIVIVLKGHRTLITDGQRSVHNSTGNPGMATGGAGDVLTGIVTALICQGLAPFEAAQLAAHVHGLAGDLAAEELGQVGMTATDLLKHLPAAFNSLQK